MKENRCRIGFIDVVDVAAVMPQAGNGVPGNVTVMYLRRAT